MPLIKAKDADAQIAQAEVLRFQDVEAEARRILADARRQAEAILAGARAEGERLKADARRSGMEAGMAEGLRVGQQRGCSQALEQANADFAARHADLTKALAGALEQFESRRRGLQSDMERDVIALAAAIARRVIKRAVDVDPACVADNLREALQLIARQNHLEIHLHPRDLEHARQFARDLMPASQFQAVGFVADASVGRGGAVLRTAGGAVDATLQAQWSRILDEILAGWQEHWLLAALTQLPAPSVEMDEGTEFVEIMLDAPAPPAATTPCEPGIVEEIDPSEVEEIDPNDAVE